MYSNLKIKYNALVILVLFYQNISAIQIKQHLYYAAINFNKYQPISITIDFVL